MSPLPVRALNPALDAAYAVSSPSPVWTSTSPAPGQAGLNVAAAGLSDRTARPPFLRGCCRCRSAHARGRQVRAAECRRSRLRLHLGAHSCDLDIARAAVRLHRGVGRNRNFVIDGDVPLHIFRQVVADANAVAVLLDRRIRLPPDAPQYRRWRTIVISVDGSVHY